ncbi:hypothetical protein [Alicyclobacillus mali (ex Roth et al. 2021)]|uniref:hypothetical protein n=1 Tax=Alicyclobacillus mali (ex Roth et al. 2021) TaxID=1123961 RepID=UPI003AF2E1FA
MSVLLASMGPPTISADQRDRPSVYGGSSSHGFNGAADDLGGSTMITLLTQNRKQRLQWGRRRSRRINRTNAPKNQAHTGFNGAADDLGGSTLVCLEPSDGDAHGVNGAADDLGGSTLGVSLGSQPTGYMSMGPPTISADQRSLA